MNNDQMKRLSLEQKAAEVVRKSLTQYHHARQDSYDRQMDRLQKEVSGTNLRALDDPSRSDSRLNDFDAKQAIKDLRSTSLDFDGDEELLQKVYQKALQKNLSIPRISVPRVSRSNIFALDLNELQNQVPKMEDGFFEIQEQTS